MKPIKTTVVINASTQDVFDCLATFDKYSGWLTPSDTYQETEILTDLPVRLGTQYRDKGSQVHMKGEVTTFDSPQKLVFTQSSEIKLLGITNKMNLSIEYNLQENGQSTSVIRNQSVKLAGLLPLFAPILQSIMKKENKRILQTLKTHLETVQ